MNKIELTLISSVFAILGSLASAAVPQAIITQPPYLQGQSAPTPEPATQSDESSAGDISTNPEQYPLPEGVNPLTAKPVLDKSLLDLPPVLVSVSNFPGATRPQMGLSFAAQVYEFWIGVGMTRFLPIFYGCFPQQLPSMIGDCAVRWDAFKPTSDWLGNFIWYDENKNGILDTSERGVPGVCISLFNADDDSLLASTSTNSNGYFGFNVSPESHIYLQVAAPLGTTFSQTDETKNGDVAPKNGISEVLTLKQTNADNNIGLIWDEKPAPTGKKISKVFFIDVNHNGVQDNGEVGISGVQVNLYNVDNNQLIAKTRTGEDGSYTFYIEEGKSYYLHILPDIGASFILPSAEDALGDHTPNSYEDPIDGRSPTFNTETFDALAWNISLKNLQVGPLRSGRIVFQTIAQYYQGARLFYASKHESVDIGGAGNVYSEDPQSISSAFLDVERLIEAAQAEAGKSEKPYASNIFSQNAPEGGVDIDRITYFVNVLNNSQWEYDPLSEAYLRYDDHSDGRGTLYPSVDRLTGRQLQFNNLLLLFTEHEQIQGLKIEMDIHPNTKNKAFLFRDGKAYPIYWSTINGAYEKRTQRLRPPRILDLEGKPFPLKPGNMWIIVATTSTTIEEQSANTMRVRFFQPSLDGDFIK